MAHLKTFMYALPCTKRASRYFPEAYRQGLLLHLDNKDEHYGTGELAPLVGIHQYTIDDLIHLLKKFSPNQLEDMFSLSEENMRDIILFFDQFSYPLSHALSMMFFHHKNQQRQQCTKKSLSLAALIEEQSLADAVTRAHNFAAQGFSCLKIKIGGLPVDLEIKKIKAIAKIVGKEVKLRLDANRKFNFVDARILCYALKKINIEYIEEPSITINHAKDLYQETGIKIAIDESFKEPFHVDKLKDLGIDVVILKPSRFKTVYHVMECAKQALRHGIKPVFSHCFESEFSEGLYARMVEKLGLLDHAHGIIAEGFFKQNVLKKPLRSFRGKLFIDEIDLHPHQFWRLPFKQII